MTNTTDTQSTAILVFLKNGTPRTTQRYQSVGEANIARETILPLLKDFTIGLIIDATDKETANTRGVTFEVESANGKTKHNIPSYGLARSYARRFATAENAVVIRQLLVTETVYSSEEAALAAAE